MAEVNAYRKTINASVSGEKAVALGLPVFVEPK
jgi:hypothetical protein